MVREHGPEYCAFCTDDREPDFLYREGHIDQMCRIAVSEGVAAEDVLVMASLHGARAHRLLDRGAIAPGYVADLVLLDASSTFAVSLVLKDGREPVLPASACRSALRDTMRSVPVSFDVEAQDWVRVIEVQPGQLITGSGVGRVGDRRPGQDRRDRAPSRDGARRARLRARLRAARRRVRLDGRP